MAKVVAIERGHDGRVFREIGDKFEVPDARLKDGSTWFVPVGKEPKEPPKPSSLRPPGAGPLKGSAVDEAAIDATSDA